MQLDKSDLSKKHKGLLPMIAADLFDEKIIQVFSKRTGEYLGFIREGEELPEDATDQKPDSPPEPDPNQLSLF